MCVTGLEWIPVALTVASAGVSAVGQIQAANADAEARRYNARVAEMNAELSRRRAKDAAERGARDEQRKRQEIAALKGKQQAALAANGVDLSFGSPLDTIVDTAMLGELDALTIRRNAANESYDYLVQAENGRADAVLNRMGADAAQTGGYLQAAGTLLGGGADAYSKYRRPTIGVYA